MSCLSAKGTRVELKPFITHEMMQRQQPPQFRSRRSREMFGLSPQDHCIMINTLAAQPTSLTRQPPLTIKHRLRRGR